MANAKANAGVLRCAQNDKRRNEDDGNSNYGGWEKGFIPTHDAARHEWGTRAA
jgi:hypothetical protein